jgi:iron uptake system component EfeO
MRLRPGVLVLLVPALVLSACGKDSKTSTSDEGNTQSFDVKLTGNACEPTRISANAGPASFTVTNASNGKVSEFEILSGQHIAAEVEDVVPGVDRTFSLTLKPGTYTTYCPGAKQDKGTLVVAASGSAAGAGSSADQRAVSRYVDYVKSEAGALVSSTAAFAGAVTAGDVEKAKSLFASSRAHYERIEPIAESFGDLDPKIDAREGDVAADNWSGFHRLEKALWVDRSVAGMGPVADSLVADITKLNKEIPGLELEPAQIANGAVGLLNEVSASKLTGEEDRYSHTDLSDVAANVDGAKVAFNALRPLLADKQAALASTIDQRFVEAEAALSQYAGSNPTGNGYVLYGALTPDQTKALSNTVDALAEPLSRVAAIGVA